MPFLLTNKLRRWKYEKDEAALIFETKNDIRLISNNFKVEGNGHFFTFFCLERGKAQWSARTRTLMTLLTNF